MQTHALRRLTMVASLAGALLIGACGDFNVTNPNQPTLDDLINNPTRTKLSAAAAGLFVGIRVDADDYIWRLGSMGREGVNLSGNNQPDYQEPYFGPLQGTGFGAAIWINEYREVLNANTYITAVPKAQQVAGPEGLSAAEVSASLGFAKTLKALALFYVVTSHGSLGAPVDVGQPITAPPAPFVSEDSVYGYIIATLNDALNNLAAGGGAFPFTMPAGYSGFDTPATFSAFNRAVAAKAYVFRATALNSTCGPATCYNAALAALALAGPAFSIGDPAQLQKGVYFNYSPGAGDLANPLSDALDAANFFALPLLIDLAQKQTDGTTPDLRAVTKIAPQTAGTPQQLGGIGILGTHKFTIYLSGGEPNPSAPIPVIRSEELALLRAEANIGLNQLGTALTDINFIRTTAGNLPALGSLGTTDQAITELLYNRKYSLLWEQGATWVDARRYGRLSTIPIPPGFANSTPPNNNFGTSNVPTRLLVPDDECRARGQESGCSPLGT
jgi:starch-binding outer membrane protein, SusD/RagB family